MNLLDVSRLSPELKRRRPKNLVIQNHGDNGADARRSKKSMRRVRSPVPLQDAIDRYHISQLHQPERQGEHIDGRKGLFTAGQQDKGNSQLHHIKEPAHQHAGCELKNLFQHGFSKCDAIEL
jgi:hypothetical protein